MNVIFSLLFWGLSGCVTSNSEKSINSILIDDSTTRTGQVLLQHLKWYALFDYELYEDFVTLTLKALNDDNPLFCEEAPKAFAPNLKLLSSESKITDENTKLKQLDGMKFKFISRENCGEKFGRCISYKGSGITIGDFGGTIDFKVVGVKVIGASKNSDLAGNYGLSLCQVIGGKPITKRKLAEIRGIVGLADYGNWCGLNNTRDDRGYPAKDGVDSVCRDHDLCLLDNGYHKCSCDGSFLRNMGSATASGPEGEAYRASAIAAFLGKPCACRQKFCSPFGCTTVQTPGVAGKC